MHGRMSFERPYPRWATRPGRALLLAALGLVGACTDDVSGIPTGAAGFGPATPVSSPDVPAPSVSSPGTGAPQRRLDGVDTCTLLTSADLDQLGGAEGAPQRDALLPQSCAYDLAGGATGDVAAVAFYKPLDQVRGQAPGGTLVSTDGYRTWLACQVDDGYQSCSAAVAVHPERTLLVLLSRRDVSDAAVQRDLETLTHTALTRLPPA